MTDRETNITFEQHKPAPMTPSYNAYWQKKSRFRPAGNYTAVPADFRLNDRKFKFSYNMNDWPWSNDPANILYNEKNGLYYSWAICRDHMSDGIWDGDWMEMVSKDCINWRQTEKRLQAGVHAIGLGTPNSVVSFMGGSAWIDRENHFGFGTGAVLFLVSMTPCIIPRGKTGTDQYGSFQSVALFVAPGGLGTPIDQNCSRLIFDRAQFPTDWRDTRLQWDKDNNQLLFVISNHQNIQFYANKSRDINEFRLIQTFDTGYQVGVECPDFRPIIDTVTGERHWLLTCSKQTPGGGEQNPQQTIAWFLGRWDGKRFRPHHKGVFEYGHEFYAQSVSSPLQDDEPDSLIMRGYIGNWAYMPNSGSPQRGFVGGCWEDRAIYVEKNIAKIRPIIDPTPYPASTQPPAGNGPVWIKAKLSAGNREASYALEWSNGSRVTLDLESTITFDTSNSGSFIYPGKSFALMPIRKGSAKKLVDVDIFINNSGLSVYIDGHQACFQIFPAGHFTGLMWVYGYRRISDVTYYDLSTLFA